MKPNILTKDDLLARSRLWPSFAGLAGIVVALVLLGHIYSAVQGSWLGNRWSLTVAASALAATAWSFRKPLVAWLVSLEFSVALLAVLLLATATGTVLLQGQAQEAFDARYGAAFGPFLRLLGFDDIFHSFAFRGLLATLAVSLACVLVDKRAWRPTEWFFLLNHGGIIVVIIGGLAGMLGGAKGFIDIREGQSTSSFAVLDRAGNRTGALQDLGFALRLDKFEVEKVAPEWKFYVYEGHTTTGKPALARGLTEAGEWTRAGHSGASFRVLAVYPDFAVKTGLRELPDGTGKPAAHVKAFDKAGNIEDLVLVPGDDGRSGVLFPETKTLFRFYWNEADVRVRTEGTPPGHLVTWKLAAAPGDGASVTLEIGKERELEGGIRIAATAFYPDFSYDGKKKLATTRSDQPRNPAIELAVTYPSGRTERRYLFSNHRDFDVAGTGNDALAFAYRFRPAEEAPEREVALIGSTREVLDYRKGQLVGRQGLPDKPTEPVAKGVSAMLLGLSPSAEVEHTPFSRSETWKNPVAEVEVRFAGNTEKARVKGGRPIPLGAGDSFLVFQAKLDDIRAFRSRVSINPEGADVKRGTIAVNSPLSFGGYRLYQSNYKKEDPKYSGIQVVKDPGLWVAYLGFGMMCLGVPCRFYLTPWLARRRHIAEKAHG
ncbi:MAG: cytochrome c biogenesis protein ResB [Planctomycetia bacterium]|nr:cytochrome c biogenesis protein ResB [Planctomycetia bacterium]